MDGLCRRRRLETLTWTTKIYIIIWVHDNEILQSWSLITVISISNGIIQKRRSRTKEAYKYHGHHHIYLKCVLKIYNQIKIESKIFNSNRRRIWYWLLLKPNNRNVKLSKDNFISKCIHIRSFMIVLLRRAISIDSNSESLFS